MFKECHLFRFPSDHPTSWINKRVETTRRKQAIPSMFEMPSFECDTTQSKRWMLSVEGATPFPCNVDFSGDRANAHYDLINLTYVLVNCVSKFLTNYHIGKKKFKPWTQQSQECKNIENN